MPPVIPDDKPGDHGPPRHRGDRGSPGARVAPARPESPLLLESTPASDEEALDRFTMFVRQYAASLVAYARSGGTDHHLAQDFVQEAFERLWTKWVDTGVLITGYAFARRIVERNKIDYFRTAKNTASVATGFSADDLEAEVDDAEYALVYTEAFRRAVAQLPPQVRRVMELTLYDGLDVPEIAERLTISVRTVSNYRVIGKKRLIEEFREQQ
jgi:RNA polymerase sigma factor (sigma-70 family)